MNRITHKILFSFHDSSTSISINDRADGNNNFSGSFAICKKRFSNYGQSLQGISKIQYICFINSIGVEKPSL